MYVYSAVLGTTVGVGVAVELVLVLAATVLALALALVPCADTNITSCDIATARLRRATPYREGAIGGGVEVLGRGGINEYKGR